MFVGLSIAGVFDPTLGVSYATTFMDLKVELDLYLFCVFFQGFMQGGFVDSVTFQGKIFHIFPASSDCFHLSIDN